MQTGVFSKFDGVKHVPPVMIFSGVVIMGVAKPL